MEKNGYFVFLYRNMCWLLWNVYSVLWPYDLLYCLSVSNELISILCFCNEHCRFKNELYILIQSYIYLDQFTTEADRGHSVLY